MTLIDKAEALAAILKKPGRFAGCTEEQVRKMVAEWIAALPARGVGVPTDCRKWDCYPIEMPLTKDGHGPAIPGGDEISRITYEVWDRTLESHASFDNLPDAINEAMRLSLAALAPTDAAQAREAHLREAAAAVRARYMGDNNREDMEVLRCEASIIAMIGEANT